jgi:PPOX class probable F420-dependent enzyme
MRLDPDEARRRFAASRVARLATVDDRHRPHLVPVTFAVTPAGAGRDLVVIAVDGKPKSSRDLRRSRNIADNPAVALLADHYRDDWTRLWWARADGEARVLPPGTAPAGLLELLAGRYAQYDAASLDGPVIVVEVRRWSGWSYSGAG